MSDFTSVKDSGKRQEFDTGSVRDTREGKGRYDLIPPIAIERLAHHFENGAVKYGDRNWEKGQPLTRYLDSAIRHIYTFLEGDRSEDHLIAGVWNLMAAVHTEEMISRGLLPFELNDLPDTCLTDPIPEPAPTSDVTVIEGVAGEVIVVPTLPIPSIVVVIEETA